MSQSSTDTSWLMSGDSIATAQKPNTKISPPRITITELNSWVLVVQTGESLLYRNKVYGFEVLLGKARQGAEIMAYNDLVFFTVPYTWEHSFNYHAPQPMSRHSRTLVTLFPTTHSDYERILQDTDNDLSHETLLPFTKEPLGRNNFYIFPNFTTQEDINISDWGIWTPAYQEFFSSFSTFDI